MKPTVNVVAINYSGNELLPFYAITYINYYNDFCRSVSRENKVVHFDTTELI